MLEGHVRRGKRFIPPLMQYDNLKTVAWHRDMLPDFLWIAVMLGRRSEWRAVYRPLDVIDRFVPEGRRIADGRLSSFALVPEADRIAARKAIQRETPHAIPSALSHALALFPTCPASWLFVGGDQSFEPDPSIGIPLLQSVIEDNMDKSGMRSTRLRMAAISRMVTHGKFMYSVGSVMEMAPKYPNNLSEREQRMVESMMRATWGSMHGIEVSEDSSSLDWARGFWRRGRELAPCRFHVDVSENPMTDEGDGPLDPEPVLQLSEIRTLLDAARALGDKLRDAQLTAYTAPEADDATAVLFGMASRMYRLVLDFLDRPSAWSPATASFYVRPLVETRIVSAWLSRRNDPALFEAYKEHGLGNLKLLRDHIKVDFGDNPDDDARQFLEYLDHRVNLELAEWAQPVNVGAFSDTTIRKMAIECDLKRLYDLSFVPMSSENHGEWPSVRDGDTVICDEPIHGGHRIGAFQASERTIGPQAIGSALQIAEEGIVAIFGRYGIDVSGDFAPVWAAFDAAMYVHDDPSEADTLE